jgi:hypothetical protein
MIDIDDLTEEQALAAAKSLCDELNRLCANQPTAIVMMAIAMLAARGITLTRSDDCSTEEALAVYVRTVRRALRW